MTQYSTLIKLPIPKIIFLDKDDRKLQIIKICIDYANHKFAKNARLTKSDQIYTENFSNILVTKSTIFYQNKEIKLDFSMPLLVYRKNNTNKLLFKNNLEMDFNFHPHGLNVDTFVDGASAITEFGPNSQLGRNFNVTYPVLNNSMISSWHPHPMNRSARFLYSGMYMPYIIKDEFSDLIETYFNLGDNDIPIAFSAIDLDKQGRLNSSRLNSYPCIYFKVNKNILNEYPNLDIKKTDEPNILDYCTSLGAWRGTFIYINSQVASAFTPNNFCQTTDVCADSLFCSDKQCLKKYKQKMQHFVKSNLLKIRLVHTGCSFRRFYWGFVDENDNFMEFWVIASGGGFVKPWKTKIISLESMNRYEILVDFKENTKISLIAYDFDITLIEKMIIPLPYLTENSRNMFNRAFFDNFSIIDGSLLNYKPTSIFEVPYKKIFLYLVNQLRSKENQVNEIPFLKNVDFIKDASNYFSLQKVIDIINQKILIEPEKYYFNYPDNPILTRNIVLSSEMSIAVDSWISGELPSLKFKFTGKSDKDNINMGNNTDLHISTMNLSRKIIKKTHIKFKETDNPINIIELVEIVNQKFKENNININYRYEKFIDNINGIVKIKSVKVILKNNDIHNTYLIKGNNNIMQLMGSEFKWGSNDINIDNPKKTSISIFLSPTMKNAPIKLMQMKDNKNMGMLTLTLKPQTEFSGNPFLVMNDNIMNFSVKRNSTERWIFYNTDNNFFDNHPLHFHLTSAFYEPEYSSPINKHNIYSGSKDLYSIKTGSHISFKIKFSNYNSIEGKVKHLGYMFHCHYLMHHDMNMMGQFYVV